MKRVIATVLIYLSSAALIIAQDFQNNDLNGIVTTGGDLPTNWQNVPHTFAACNASSSAIYVTPDLTDLTGPLSSLGVNGNPYSGTTLVSGLYASSGTNYWHEGIMQVVTGFSIGQTYTIHFHQAVVKQKDAIDQSGSWSVYADNTLIGVTPVTISAAAYDSNSFIWEAEAVSFTATAASITFSFLPTDDDANTAFSFSDSTGGLRMGIDSIYIENENVKGIHDLYSTSFISVYPNPFSHTATLQFYNPGNEPCIVMLFNQFGQIVRTINASMVDKVEIERGDLPPGLYTCQVLTETGIIARGRLVIE